MIILNFNAQMVLLSREALAQHIVSYANFSFLDEVHVSYFIFFVENKVHRFILFELLRLEPEADVVKEF